MSQAIDDLIRRIKELQEELEIEFKRKRDEFEFIIEEKRVRFAEEVAKQQRRLKEDHAGIPSDIWLGPSRSMSLPPR